jgi:hypothetical protein
VKRRAAAAAASLALLAGARSLAAGPPSEVASAFDAGDPVDVHVSLEYRYSFRRASVKRELAGLPGADPDGPTPLVKDLVFSGARHELVPRLEIGVYTDVSLTASLPVVLRDVRRLEFDQRAGDCVFPADPGQASCIDASNSTTVADGLLPADAGAGDGVVFRGPRRAGLDQLELGAIWAPLVQARDPSKPTWKVGGELRLSVGQVMRYRRAHPGRQDGVSRGVDELRLATSMARRIGWAEPYFELWWMAPIGTRDRAPLDAPALSFGAEKTGPQQRAGARFGLEAILWQNPSRDEGVALLLGGELEALFAGRAYTDMWEVFAFAGDVPAGGPLTLDADPVAEDRQASPHPGVSNVEDYLTAGGRAAVAAHLAEWVRLDLGVQFDWEQSHLISNADPGDDGGDDNAVVDPGTGEVNPLYVSLIDAAGHRYRVDEGLTYTISAAVRVLF